MKVMKTLKNLKFWSKKKKKRINIHHHSPPPSCCCHRHRHRHDSSHTVQPSAPPLPAWLDYEEPTYNQHLLASEFNFSPGLPISYQPQFDPQEDDVSIVPAEPGLVNPSTSSSSSPASGGSYQQYMIENPAYEVPVLPSRKTRSAGAVGCVFSIGAHLFRCFFPCVSIREV